MKHLILIAGLWLAGLGVATPQAGAQQGLLFSPSFLTYSYKDKVSGSSMAEVNANYMDVRLGYIHSSGLYLGGLYATMSRADFTTDRKRTSFGPSLGFVYHQFFLMGHYLLSSEYQTASGTTLKEGSGVQVELGYFFSVTGLFYAGPQIVHRDIAYKKSNSTAVSDTNSSETLPYLTLAFIF